MFKTRIPPPLYTLLAGVVMLLLHRYLPGPVILGSVITPWAWLVAALGGAVTAWAVVTFRRARTTLNPLAPSKARRLVTHGPYNVTRNPMYLGLSILLLGWAGWLGTLSGFFVLPVFVALVTYQQILPEERALEDLFGEEYVRYRHTVRRWLGRSGHTRRRRRAI